MYAEAIAEYKRALQLGGSPAEMRGLLGNAYAVSGNRTDAVKDNCRIKVTLARAYTCRPRPGSGVFRFGG